MNPNIRVTNKNLAHFETLTSLGIKNFFTFDNAKWLNVVPRLEKTEYLEIFTSMNLPLENIFYMGAEHLDNIRVVDESNIALYKEFTKFEKYKNSVELNLVNCDGMITKENITILVAPADCAIICITGVDKKDNRRFIAVIHAGIFGTMLEIHKKALEKLKSLYEFNLSDLQSFIYPTIDGKNYVKSKEDKTRGHLFKDNDWQNYVVDKGENFEVHFRNKIIDDLKSAGVTNIHISELNTYAENEKGNLFSYVYQKEKKVEEFRNFLVGFNVMK